MPHASLNMGIAGTEWRISSRTSQRRATQAGPVLDERRVEVPRGLAPPRRAFVTETTTSYDHW